MSLAMLVATVAALFLATPASAGDFGDDGQITVSRLVNGRNYCLDVPNNNAVNGQDLWMWDCNGTPAQEFSLVGNQIVHDDSGKCIDIENNGGSGAAVQLWDCNDIPAQRWQVTEVNPSRADCLPVLIGGGDYNECRSTVLHLIISSSDRCLDMRGGIGQVQRRSAVQVWESDTCGKVQAQQWR